MVTLLILLTFHFHCIVDSGIDHGSRFAKSLGFYEETGWVGSEDNFAGLSDPGKKKKKKKGGKKKKVEKMNLTLNFSFLFY